MQPVRAAERCETCGTRLVAWPYVARDGDLLFAGAYEVIDGKGDAQTRAALICPNCDWPRRFPRHR